MTGVEVFVPEQLRQYCGNARTLDVSGTTVRSVLAEMEREFPALYVNDDHMRDRDGLDSILAPGDEVTILPAVSGG